MVALLAEGGDRNQMQSDTGTWIATSPSSRRAGIEILYGYFDGLAFGVVALLAEGGDRNSIVEFCPLCDTSRPPRGGRG